MNNTPKILIIEDEKKIAGWIKIYLEQAGFSTEIAYDGVEGLNMIHTQNPDLIILDLMLPRMRGEEVCTRVRQKSNVPIIILTAKNTKSSLLNCLDSGSDDYMTKPFDPDELISRVNALLRRSYKQSSTIQKCGALELNRETGTFTVNGENIPLSAAQLSIMEIFMDNPNIILSRAKLIEIAFQSNFTGYERAIDNHITRIRNLINTKDFNPIKTIYGSGYKLEC